MIKLTTYLGHTTPDNTYWYLEAVPELLELASRSDHRRGVEAEPDEGDQLPRADPALLHRPALHADGGEPPHGRWLP